MTDTLLASEAPLIRARLIRVRGSSPREEGAEMFISALASEGTIGGGRAEQMAMEEARAMLAEGRSRADLDIPLGPEIGQCCGGRILVSLTLMTADERREAMAETARQREAEPAVHIFGAGHTGRALALALAPLPLRPVLIDSREEEITRLDDPRIEKRLTPLPEAEIAKARPGDAFVILTHDHGLDFIIAAAALQRGDAGFVGMIGSATKRASFEAMARREDIPRAEKLTCPIGAAGKGDKRPAVIAAHVAAEILIALARGAAKTKKDAGQKALA